MLGREYPISLQRSAPRRDVGNGRVLRVLSALLLLTTAGTCRRSAGRTSAASARRRSRAPRSSPSHSQPWRAQSNRALPSPAQRRAALSFQPHNTTAAGCQQRDARTLSSPPPRTRPSLAQDLLDLDPSEASRPDFAEYFGGNKVLPGAEPAAHCYCGHQFGHFSGQLGDGATMYLGEVINDR